MAVINLISNTASVLYDTTPISSLPVVTNLLLPPTILKTVDKTVASIGDVLTYTILITNLGLTVMNDLPFTDILPDGITYVEDSFKLDDSTVSPTITNNTLTYTIDSIAALGTATISFQATIVGGNN